MPSNILENRVRNKKGYRLCETLENISERTMGKQGSELPDRSDFEVSVRRGIKDAVIDATAKKATKESLKFLAKEYGIKTVPFLGTIKAAIDFVADAVIFIKNLRKFTKELLQSTDTELQGLTSVLGGQLLIEASVDNLHRVAEAIRNSNMTQQQADQLYRTYLTAQNNFKSVLVNLLLMIKELSLGWSLGLAVTITVLPVETVFRKIMFTVSKHLVDLKNSEKDFHNVMYQLLFGFRMFESSYILPIIGFLTDPMRVAAFAEVDEALVEMSKRGFRAQVGDQIALTARGGKKIYDIGKETADIFSKAVDAAAVSLEEDKKLDTERWQDLAGIN